MIKLENINKTYNNGSPLHVLKGINHENVKRLLNGTERKLGEKKL